MIFYENFWGSSMVFRLSPQNNTLCFEISFLFVLFKTFSIDLLNRKLDSKARKIYLDLDDRMNETSKNNSRKRLATKKSRPKPNSVLNFLHEIL